jgi:hypothetical protein
MVVAAQDLEPAVAAHLVLRPADDLAEARVGVPAAAALVGLENADRRVLGERPEALLRLAQGLLAAVAGGDVVSEADVPDDLAVLVAQRRHRVGDPHVRPVAAHERPFPRLRPAVGEGQEHGPAGLDAELARGRVDLLGQVQVEAAHPAHDLVGRVAEQALRAAVEEGDEPAGAGGEDRVAGGGGEHARVVVALGPQAGDDGLVLGPVHARPEPAEQRSGGPSHPPGSGHGVATIFMVPSLKIGTSRPRLRISGRRPPRARPRRPARRPPRPWHGRR